MLTILIQMHVLPDKQREFRQTIQAISELTRKEKGCVRHYFYQSMENENEFSLIEQWKTRKDLQTRLHSDVFTVFLGALTLLSEHPEIAIGNLSHGVGLENMRPSTRRITTGAVGHSKNNNCGRKNHGTRQRTTAHPLHQPGSHKGL